MLSPPGANGQRLASMLPPRGSMRITSAPSWAKVMPPNGAAMKADTSTTRSPANGAFML